MNKPLLAKSSFGQSSPRPTEQTAASDHTAHSGQTAVSVQSGSDAIQPELALSRPGLTTYVWQICGADILIEVADDGQVRVNGEIVQAAPIRRGKA